MSTLPWIEKYRPVSLEEVLAQQDTVDTLKKLMFGNRLPHLLLYGPAGTGKTSTAIALAKQLYGSKYKSMTLELNASDERGIAVVRDQIKSFASTQQIFASGCKFIILDEADSMTSSAQFSLRRSELCIYC